MRQDSNPGSWEVHALCSTSAFRLYLCSLLVGALGNFLNLSDENSVSLAINGLLSIAYLMNLFESQTR